MKPGFTEIDRQTFYRKIWPRIKDKVDAMVSNLADCKAAKTDLLMVEWGHKNKETGEVIIVAVSHSKKAEYERHWVDPALLVE